MEQGSGISSRYETGTMSSVSEQARARLNRGRVQKEATSVVLKSSVVLDSSLTGDTGPD
jgi:hypothetical protein